MPRESRFERQNSIAKTQAPPLHFFLPKSAKDESEANLTEANLVEANLAGANLRGANLTNSELSKANLADSNLTEANLSGTILIETIFFNANMCRANLIEANLDRAMLTGANLNLASLNLANLTRASLVQANLGDASLAGANLSLADLTEANLNSTALIGTKLDGARLRHSQMHRTKLSESLGHRADFSEVSFVSKNPQNRIREFLLKLFSWQTVRAVGELQILTKASYVMLALVPLLAGAWHGVKLWVDQSKNSVSETLNHIDRSMDTRHLQINSVTTNEVSQLKASISGLKQALDQREKFWLGNAPKETIEALKIADKAIEHFQTAVERESENDSNEIHTATQKLRLILQRDQLNPKLPSAWALGFFASLFVALGHFAYQVWCPELVKAQTEDNFADMLLKDFSADSDRNYQKDQLVRAINSLGEIAVILPNLRHQNLVRRHRRTVWIPSDPNLFDEPADSSSKAGEKDTINLSESPRPPVIMAGLGLMRIGIEEGAKTEYFLKSLENRGIAAAAFLLYLLAGSIIAWLVLSQSWTVAKSVGWLS